MEEGNAPAAAITDSVTVSTEQEFEAQLRSMYERSLPHDRWEAAWLAEREPAMSAVADVVREVEGRYSLEKPIGLGGSGITVLLVTTDGKERAVAKLARPAPGVADQLNRNLRKEMTSMRGLRHQNVIRVLAHSDGVETGHPYYIMEFLEDVDDADEYLKARLAEEPRSADEHLVSIVRQSLLALQYVHSQGIVHLDIKPPNLFIDRNGLLVMADFGFAKHLESEDGDITSNVGGTKRYMHPDYFRLMTSVEEDTRALRESLERDKLQYAWDIFSLGAAFLELLEIADSADPDGYSSYTRRYLRLLASRMLDGRADHARIMGVPVANSVLGLSTSALDQIRVASATQALEDLKKLTRERDLGMLAPEANRYHEQIVQAATHSSVAFSNRVQALVETEAVRRLVHLPQLGLVHLVYPTATHSRFEHTIGAYAMVCKYVRGLYNDSINPIFRQLLSVEDLSVALAASIVHDIGHYPLAHDLEEVDREIFGHDVRASDLLADGSEVGRVLADGEWSVPLERLRRIVGPSRDGLPIMDQMIRALIDGPLDADKIDYLIRDSENLRLPYGKGIDYERLVMHLTVTIEEVLNRPEVSLSIHENGKIAAESIAFARYALYGAVYWHRTHRAAKAMLQHLAYTALDARKKADVVRKTGYKKEFRSALYAFLDGSGDQAVLPGLGAGDDLVPSTVVDPQAAAIIDWLDHQGSFGAAHLASSLKRRDLFKRVLVVSRGFNSALEWDRVDRLYGGEGDRWEERFAANQILQNAVLERVGAFAGRGETVSTVTTSVADEFISEAQNRQLVLIDHPPSKPGSTTPLKVLREREGRLPGEDDFSVSILEPSTMWGRLREEAPSGIAKLRVFASPKYRSLLRVAMSREDFERLVRDAINASLR